MKNVALVIITLVGCVLAHAQSPGLDRLDSLERKINAYSQKDTIRVKLILDFARKSQNENSTRLLPYLLEATEISKAKRFTRGLQAAYIQLQSYYSDREDAEKASLYADTAFSYLKNDTSFFAQTNMAWLHNNIAGDYANLADYQQAIEHLLEAATVFEKIEPASLGGVYGNIASMYAYLLLPERALEYDKKAIAAAANAKDTTSFTQRNIGYAARLLDAKRFTEAEEVLKKIEPLVLKLNKNSANTFFYQNRGLVKKSKGDYNAAILDLKKAYLYTIESKRLLHQLTLLEPLTSTLMEAGKMDEAKIYLDSLLKNSLAYKIKEAELNAYTGLAEWYTKKGDPKTANGYLKKSILLTDSISSENMKDKIAAMETKFRVEGKNSEIKRLQAEQNYHTAQLQQKSTFNYILTGGIAALALVSLLAYRNHKNRQKLQQQRIAELETEKQLAATEAILTGETQERQRLAKDLHDGLGGMLSGIKHSLHNMKGNLILTPEHAQAFERSLDMLNSSIQEMRRVAHNMMPEALVNLGLAAALDDFCSDINQSGVLQINYQTMGTPQTKLPQSIAINIYRIVQELVNNTIKHSNATTALVQLTHTPTHIQITVEDNGKGMDSTQLQTQQGMGWKNIYNRIAFINGSIDVQAAPAQGMSVNLEVPLFNNDK